MMMMNLMNEENEKDVENLHFFRAVVWPLHSVSTFQHLEQVCDVDGGVRRSAQGDDLKQQHAK
jgi:hypothetical protein